MGIEDLYTLLKKRSAFKATLSVRGTMYRVIMGHTRVPEPLRFQIYRAPSAYMHLTSPYVSESNTGTVWDAESESEQ